MNRSESGFRWAALLLLAGCVAYALMNPFIIADAFSRSPLKTALFLGWTACGFATFFAFSIAARPLVFWPVLLLAFVSLATNFAYPSIVHAPLTLDVIEWLPQEFGQLGHAGSEFAPEIAFAMLRAAALVGIFVVIRRLVRRAPGIGRRLASHPRAALVATAAFVAFHAAALVLQPPSSVAETNLYVFGVPSLLRDVPDPSPVDARPVRQPSADKIVVVVDESITHEAFDKIVAAQTAGLPVFDFGEAAATTNCSAPSNALLRWGIDRSRVQRADYDPRTNPTLWAYAHAAGYRTMLIDGQSGGQKQNFLSPKELALIDEFVPADAGMDTDVNLARRLNDILRRPGRELVLAVKRGAHFPYPMNYPAAELPPDAPRAAKYRAAVSYTTGAFFAALARNAPFDRALVLYTSDHGQDLAKRSPHCNPDPSDREYSVPLLAITSSRELAAQLAPRRLFDHAAHPNIFATVLNALGYEHRWIEAQYGPGLDGAPTPYLTYVHRGWQAEGAAMRHTVRSGDFVNTDTFPRRQDLTPER